MSHGTGVPARPENGDTLDRWRVGIVAFRIAMREELSDNECHKAGVAAMQAAFPTMEDPGPQMVQAIGSVPRSEYAAWFWAARPEREWIWPPDHRGVGHYRR